MFQLHQSSQPFTSRSPQRDYGRQRYRGSESIRRPDYNNNYYFPADPVGAEVILVRFRFSLPRVQPGEGTVVGLFWKQISRSTSALSRRVRLLVFTKC